MSQEKTNAMQFLDSYAIIEHEMNKIMREERYTPFTQLLEYCARHNWIVSKNKTALREYHELRNAIVHLRDSKTEIIAEPSDAVTADIARIAQLLQHHDNLIDYASKPVQYAKLEDTMWYVYDKIKKLDTTKLPVYHQGTYKGIITIESLCACAMQGTKDSAHASQLMDEERKNRVVFMKQDESVVAAVEAFEKAFRQGNRLLAIIVTEHGNKYEEPLGIITMKDLVEMIETIL